MQRRHLNWENRVVLPLAQRLLTEEDKQDLARRMIARRSSSEPT
jgi:hemerythrin-like domain-containing protein